MFGRITPIVRNLLIINVAIYFLSSLLNINVNEFLSLKNLHSSGFMPLQYISYMFLHGSTMHLFSNMFGLFIFGPLLEQFWGPKRFLIFYMVTGIGAGILYSGINYIETNKLVGAVEAYHVQPDPAEFKYVLEKKANIDVKRHADINSFIYDYVDHPENASYIAESKQILSEVLYFKTNSQMVGASGAIFGILMAFGLLFPNTVLMLLIPPIPIKAKYLVAIYAVYEIFAGIRNEAGDDVAHFAHISGAIVAIILLRIWNKDRMKFF